jgi:hypothetical protein
MTGFKMIWVKAAPLPDPALAGQARVPRWDAPNRYITEDEAVEVPEVAYYTRRLTKNPPELIQVNAPDDEE